MAALQCDICGGKLMGRPGGIFECDSCGMQYDTAWAKEKIQEIKGTVKVEGTVEVTGTVKVDGAVKVEGGITKETLLKHASLKMEEGDFTHAIVYLKQALDMDPESGDIYWSLMMGRNRLGSVEELLNYTAKDMTTDSDFKMVMRFGNVQQKAILAKWEQNYNQFLTEKAAEAAEKAARDATAQAVRDAKRPALEARRKQTMPARNMLTQVGLLYGMHTIVMPDGHLERPEGYCFNSQEDESLGVLRDVQAIRSCSGGVFFLDFDGNVAYLEKFEYRSKPTYLSPRWFINDGQAIALGSFSAYKQDGTVVYWETIRYGSGAAAEKGTAKISADQVEKIRATGPIVYVEDESMETVYQQDNTHILLTDGSVVNKKTGEVILEDIVSMSGNYFLRVDGTVANLNSPKDRDYLDVSHWKNIAAIYTGYPVYAFTDDGYLISKNSKAEKRSQKRYFNSLAELQETLAYHLSEEGKQKRQRRNRKEALEKEREKLTIKLSGLGLFDGKQKKELKTQLSQIETELKELK